MLMLAKGFLSLCFGTISGEAVCHGEGGRGAGMQTPAQGSGTIRLQLAMIGGPLLCCWAAGGGGRKGL